MTTEVNQENVVEVAVTEGKASRNNKGKRYPTALLAVMIEEAEITDLTATAASIQRDLGVSNGAYYNAKKLTEEEGHNLYFDIADSALKLPETSANREEVIKLTIHHLLRGINVKTEEVAEAHSEVEAVKAELEELKAAIKTLPKDTIKKVKDAIISARTKAAEAEKKERIAAIEAEYKDKVEQIDL